ncbi:hypothetical protein TcYC6_0001580 [Trypanosoma cruzi]|uniref:Secreted protein n=1 Tax=Trypanosoma cruzi (strain CL Brener) TaxID=353153 RepID=Q4CZ69_TRYCC|nr:hypothetical protein Tc00.1047053509521.70 [Trypanosoma cruzi]EAN85572.1 hypothetical protein Tc00.1047053509521.70 [Trypanosoma cruzi]KAF8287627.1 hypothetical protein TcYC6_0001580 [Trypanosoma cruzi]|eukprot:XP_807423.1 hypothetical protein [Trypanosoma cruzi strain CL Brener]
MSLSSLFLFISAMHFCCAFLFVRPFKCSAPVFTSLLRVCLQAHTTTCTHRMHIAVDLDASFVACAGGCGWLLLPPWASREGGERERAPRVTLPAGVMRAVGCDCCGGPHPFGVRFSAVVPCVCACHFCARACWACFSGALSSHHHSLAACVSEHVRMRVRAYGMKEWLEERGI